MIIVEIILRSTGIVTIPIPPTISEGRRPAQTGRNIVPRGFLNGKNLGREQLGRERFSLEPVAKDGGYVATPYHQPPKESRKNTCKQTEDPLATAEELKAMQRGRRTKLSRGDSEMDRPYTRRNETIKQSRGC